MENRKFIWSGLRYIEIFALVKESSTQMVGHKSLTAMAVTTAYTGVTTTCSRHYIRNLNFQ